MFPWHPRYQPPTDHPPDVSPGEDVAAVPPTEPPVPPVFDTLRMIRTARFYRWLVQSGRVSDTDEGAS